MEDSSILTSVKMALGIPEEHEYFDAEIVMHINSVFSTLHQLGVGPVDTCFRIQNGDEEWSSFLSDEQPLDMVKTYMYLRVRLLFDPPSSSFVVNSFEHQIEELEWRINVIVDSEA